MAKGSKNIFTIQKNDLEKVLSNLQNSFNKKDTLDLSTSILIEAESGKLTMKATDNEIISMKVTANLKTCEGRIFCAIKGELLSNNIKSLEDSEVIFEYDKEKERLTIKQDNDKTSLQTFNIFDEKEDRKKSNENDEYSEDALIFPFSDDYKTTKGYKKIEIDNILLLNALKNVSHCCNEKEHNQRALQGVFLEIKNNFLNMAATDNKRLAYMQEKYDNKDINFECIIPKKAINEIEKLSNSNFDIYIKDSIYENEYEENEAEIETICFVTENIELYIKTINSKFPEYKEATNYNKELKPIIFEKEKLIKALQKMNSSCSMSKITIKPDEIILDTINGLNNSSRHFVINNIETGITEEQKIGIVNKYLLECISNSKTEYIEAYIDENLFGRIYFDLKDFKEVIVLSDID